ncbi:MAG: hypothetical protein HRU70_04640 [Phycisphaeraceae bacterium]|nr:MAG: hypothetical protein HRU70_04640 [Phycisphaeraceae bacterium]
MITQHLAFSLLTLAACVMPARGTLGSHTPEPTAREALIALAAAYDEVRSAEAEWRLDEPGNAQIYRVETHPDGSFYLRQWYEHQGAAWRVQPHALWSDGAVHKSVIPGSYHYVESRSRAGLDAGGPHTHPAPWPIIPAIARRLLEAPDTRYSDGPPSSSASSVSAGLALKWDEKGRVTRLTSGDPAASAITRSFSGFDRPDAPWWAPSRLDVRIESPSIGTPPIEQTWTLASLDHNHAERLSPFDPERLGVFRLDPITGEVFDHRNRVIATTSRSTYPLGGGLARIAALAGIAAIIAAAGYLAVRRLRGAP